MVSIRWPLSRMRDPGLRTFGHQGRRQPRPEGPAPLGLSLLGCLLEQTALFQGGDAAALSPDLRVCV